MSNSPITKKLMIESQSTNGRCYVRLLAMLPAFKACGVKELEHAIVYMTQALGIKPEGSKILPELFITNKVLEGDLDFPTNANYESLNAINSVQFMETIFNSTVRFAWEEIDGVQHIGGYIDTGVQDREVYNELGYGARFIMCVIINPGVRVGSEMTFHNLFDQIENFNEIEYDNQREQEEVVELNYHKPPNMRVETNFNDSGIASENDELKVNLNDRLKEIEVLNKQVNALQRRIGSTANHQRSPELDDMTIRRFNDLFNKQTMLNAKSPKTHVFPDDSSSNIGRYNNKYLEDGTIIDVRGNGQTVLQTSRAYGSLRPDKEVVVGYKRSDEMVVRENKIYQRVNAINGLANPFHSHRLNFLCHFDTAIKSIQLRKEDYTHFDVIVWISKHKSLSPSQELLYQVVMNTFDLENTRIVANPYKLPFLEVGMLISDDCLAKCFDLMRLEHKTLWFEKMKGLTIPEFHNDFSTHKEHKLTSGKDKVKDPKEVRLTKQGGKPMTQRRKSSGSILSFIKE
jgi:hypothetical protein